ncbi:MAG: histidine kinase, partial [Lachnospiraceae bacterium]|nr:histidine kinase [Lachnospiraceae bacterium]
MEQYELSSHDAVAKALFENYESIYVVDAETSAYQCFHESDTYSMLPLEKAGDNFFKEMLVGIVRTIYPEDQDYVRRRLTKEVLHASLEKDSFYSFVYRLMIEGQPLYHKLRATMGLVEGRPHFLIGIRNVDAAFRQDKKMVEKLSSMHNKEVMHLEAILASAEGYLEADLSNDTVVELSSPNIHTVLADKIVSKRKNVKQASGRAVFEAPKEDVRKEDTPKEGLKNTDTHVFPLSYSESVQLMAENWVVDNKEKFLRISDRKYLIDCFEHGEKRASASFSMRVSEKEQPCKIVFYLYEDAMKGDLLAFCVLYDLTEQQRKEKELRDLENELQRSRLRNFTSQMQPHFLYNALGSIQEIVLEDPVYASELLGDFTTHLRSCIRAMANDAAIPFDQELANIKAYVNIERMRFGQKLKVIYDIQTDDFKILPLSVQPIVENAIRHGIYERGGKGGTVVVRTQDGPDSVKIIVEDNGIG